MSSLPSSPPDHAPVLYTPSVEQIDPEEAAVTSEIDASMAKIREKTFADSGHAIRSVHAKLQGALRVTLIVEPGLPEPLAQGLFAQPGRYEALMRFSTIPGDILDDKVSVPRGLAIKVVGVPGERLPGSEGDVTQNFLFVDAPSFNAPNAKKFSSSLKQLAGTTDRGEGAKKALSSVLQVTEKVVEAFGGKSATLISMGGHAPTQVLGATYYTAAALRHGRYIAKLSIAPASPELKALTDQKVDLDDRPDGLREELVDFMRTHRAEWVFQVQLCRDLEKMPVEDPSVDWSQELSPYVTVARVVAEPQSAYSEALARAIDDGMFFSPWRGLLDHQPLGNVMRARKAAYERSAHFRAERNGRPVVEPRDLTDLPT
jgi:hypothetical protein